VELSDFNRALFEKVRTQFMGLSLGLYLSIFMSETADVEDLSIK